jgi:hypothetical protein
LAFLLKANLIRTLFSEKNANFFAENWQKWQKSVFITSTPGTQTGGVKNDTLGFLKIRVRIPPGDGEVA